MSRNTIESLRLGELAAETGVRVVGASDGFDSANPQSSLLLPVLGSMNEAFITQLRSKVKRGMDDAFRRGDNISPPGVGYRLVDLKDANGNLLADGDSVTVAKDLKIKGSSQVVKVGTKVKNIRLIEGDHNIDCKIDGIGPMKLKSEFVKKA